MRTKIPAAFLDLTTRSSVHTANPVRLREGWTVVRSPTLICLNHPTDRVFFPTHRAWVNFLRAYRVTGRP